MTWRVYGNPWYTSELTDTTIYQPIKFPRLTVVRAVRIRLIFVGNPTFTSINCKIYADDVTATTPTPSDKLLYTSTDSRTKAELVLAENNGVKDTYFTFNDVALRSNTWFHIVINGSGYTYADASHIAWMKAFPDPYFPDYYTPTLANLGTGPFAAYVIGADF